MTPYMIAGAVVGLPLGWWLACRFKSCLLDALVGVGIVAFVAIVTGLV